MAAATSSPPGRADAHAQRRRRQQRVRELAGWLHRYVGLATAGFLFVVGLTGAMLAFNFELEHILAPQFFATPLPNQAPLDLATLAERAEAIVPHGRAQIVAYTCRDQIKVDFLPRVNPATGKPYDLGFTEFFLDPWTGRELGRRNRGDLSQGLVNLMPFLYELHWTLQAGQVGRYILGSVALAWTLDCFIAFYLTLPRGRGGFWRRWRLAWKVKWNSTAFRVNFDLHRAGGLWLWGMLFIFAWSSVMMNIRPVFDAVMSRAFDYQTFAASHPPRPEPQLNPRLDWRAALITGERLMAEQSRLRGFSTREALGIGYDPEFASYFYEVRGSRDIFERAPKGGGTSVEFDGDTGVLRELSTPTGQHLGNTLESWLYALHMARVFGRPYQVFVSLLGLSVAMLSATGVYIWWRKRKVQRLPARCAA